MRICLAAVLLLTVFVLPAWGDAGGIPHDPHQAEHTAVVGLTNEAGFSGTFDTSTNGTWTEQTGEDGQLHFYYDFYDPEGYDIMDGANLVGEIISLSYDGKPDPMVQVAFACRAGGSATTFSFKTTIGVIPQITNAVGRASASLTLTDSSTNGAYVNGNYGGDTYQARYNNGSVFTSLVQGFSITGGSLAMSENDPIDGVSYRAIGGTVTQMEAEYNFVLKQFDSASGTSQYVILGDVVPEPSSIVGLASAMVGLIGFGLRKRR